MTKRRITSVSNDATSTCNERVRVQALVGGSAVVAMRSKKWREGGNGKSEWYREAKSPKAVRVPVLQLPEHVHIPFPDAPHEGLKPGAKRAAECGGGQTRLLTFLRLAFCHLGMGKATKSKENSEQFVGFGVQPRRQHVPGRFGVVKYYTCERESEREKVRPSQLARCCDGVTNNSLNIRGGHGMGVVATTQAGRRGEEGWGGVGRGRALPNSS